MRLLLHKLGLFFSGIFGVGFYRFIAWFGAAGYYFFFPSIRRDNADFFRRLLPGKSLLFYLRLVWRQYHNFSRIFIDRISLFLFDDIEYEAEGWHYIEEAARSGRGGIILNSHLGNWEVAAHLLRRHKIKLMIYMGARDNEKMEKVQKEGLKESGITVKAVPESGASPYDIIDGMNFIRNGGLISLAGDRLWGPAQRKIEVDFAGEKIMLPEAPYYIALHTGAPLLIFFVFSTGRKKYRFIAMEPLYLKQGSKKENTEAVRSAAGSYAKALENYAREHPAEWFNFSFFKDLRAGNGED